MSPANDNAAAGDLLLGAAAIAGYLGINARQAYRLIYSGVLPTFKLGSAVSARRSSLNLWLAEQEAASKASA